MRQLVFILLSSILISACKKEEKTYTVLYKVVSDLPTSGYTVRYTLPEGSTKSLGPVTDQFWTSGTLEGYKKSTNLSFSMENTGGSYHMYIYINDVLTTSRDAGGGGTQTLEAHTPG
jgi:hypothetical protein